MQLLQSIFFKILEKDRRLGFPYYFGEEKIITTYMSMKKGCASKYKIPSKNMQAEYPKTWPYEGSFNEY